MTDKMAKCFEKMFFWRKSNSVRNMPDRFSDDDDSSSDDYSNVYDKEKELVKVFGPDQLHRENLSGLKITSFDTLGSGAFSVVKECFSEKYGDCVAIKIIKLDEETNKSYVEKFLPVEIKLWSKLSVDRNNNILNLLETFTVGNFQYLVTELAGKGDLNEFLLNGTLSEHKAKVMFKDIVSAVMFCHDMGIAHRDIKPENILISNNGFLKLADFSFVTEDNPVIWERCGTPRMLAPEQTTLASYDPFKSDVWQVAITLYLMLFKKYPFQSTKKAEIINELKSLKTTYNNVPFPKNRMASKELKNLLCNMLELVPSNRISIGQAALSTWLTHDK